MTDTVDTGSSRSLAYDTYLDWVKKYQCQGMSRKYLILYYSISNISPFNGKVFFSIYSLDDMYVSKLHFPAGELRLLGGIRLRVVLFTTQTPDIIKTWQTYSNTIQTFPPFQALCAPRTQDAEHFRSVEDLLFIHEMSIRFEQIRWCRR